MDLHVCKKYTHFYLGSNFLFLKVCWLKSNKNLFYGFIYFFPHFQSFYWFQVQILSHYQIFILFICAISLVSSFLVSYTFLHVHVMVHGISVFLFFYTEFLLMILKEKKKTLTKWSLPIMQK